MQRLRAFISIAFELLRKGYSPRESWLRYNSENVGHQSSCHALVWTTYLLSCFVQCKNVPDGLTIWHPCNRIAREVSCSSESSKYRKIWYSAFIKGYIEVGRFFSHGFSSSPSFSFHYWCHAAQFVNNGLFGEFLLK